MRRMMRSTAVALTVGTLGLTACSAGTGSESQAELDAIEIMVPYFTPTAPEDGNAIDEKLDELAGIDVKIRWVPNADYKAQTTTTLASDDVPDAMVITSKDQAFVQTAEAGGFWDLTEYINAEDYPNLAAADPDITAAAGVNGKIYGIYRGRDLIRQSITLRKDWLENLGLELPETTEDLAEIARAFTEDDPDGNGQDDTYGLIWANWGSIGQGNSLDAISTWFGAGNVWKDIDGSLEPQWAQPEWKESLDYLRDLYSAGYLNQDFATFNADDWYTAFVNGEGGIIIDQSSRATALVTLLKEDNPATAGDYVTVTGQLEGPNGRFALPTAGYSGVVAISKATVQSEDQLAQVLSALDKLNTREAQVLLTNGIEGENFTVEDDYAVYDSDKQELTDLAGQAYAQIGMNVAGVGQYTAKPETEYEEALLAARLEDAAADAEHAVLNPAAGLVAPTYVSNQTTLDQIIDDARIQYVVGDIDEAGLEAAVERWRSSGGDTVAAELNELYAAE